MCLAEGEIPPDPCPVGGGGRWSTALVRSSCRWSSRALLVLEEGVLVMGVPGGQERRIMA